MGGPQAPPPQVVVPGAGWVDIASRAIVQVGFPVVVAGVLLWFLLTRFQGNMEMITTRMQANTEAAYAFIDSQKSLMYELQAQNAEMKIQTNELKAQTTAMERIQKLAEQRDDRERHRASP